MRAMWPIRAAACASSFRTRRITSRTFKVSATGPPARTPAEQIAFLGNIERLLSEGQFVATYKYALLIAIADLAVQLGSDDGSELELPLRAIAEQFLELYWRHS